MSGGSDRAGVQPPKPRWLFDRAGLELTIEQLPAGRWVAVYGGFSRAEDAKLSVAVAVAAGASPHEPWVAEVVRRIQSDETR